MKVFVALLVILAIVTAEPPRYRQFGRQSEAPAVPPAQAPYPPSGWKPQGARLTLPARQTQPAQKYGPPSPSYGPPTQEYGPPEPTTETDESATVEPEAETVPPSDSEAERLKVTPFKGQKQRQKSANIARGQYYLLLSDGRLQRVMYVTESDLRNMGYTAKLRYQDVEPITGPIFNSAHFDAPFVPAFQ